MYAGAGGGSEEQRARATSRKKWESDLHGFPQALAHNDLRGSPCGHAHMGSALHG